MNDELVETIVQMVEAKPAPKVKNKLITFENPDQLQKELDNLAETASILNVIPMKYRVGEMGEVRKLISVIILYI